MRLFFGALVFNFMLFFYEIEEASGMKLSGSKTKRTDQEGLSVNHFALDLNQYPIEHPKHPNHQESEEPSRPKIKRRKINAYSSAAADSRALFIYDDSYERNALQLFKKYYSHPPSPTKLAGHSEDFTNNIKAAPKFPLLSTEPPYNHFAVPGHYGFVPAPLPLHSEGHPGGSGIQRSAE
ncbi:uncharacterized protein LOC117173393 [Belonocnema kinseyi]|uniref:uncharacterized protein LOC117173393 n=1 Tax=Belonocnema kinseyi TaxID=2817044 RepID=UPI00143CF86B|nr:uncharacterized protein LOC117173393 [Belonocnema kinseyi]